MDLLHPPPPGFDRVAKAFAMARHLPATHRLDLRIGLVTQGVLFAAGRLDGYRQVKYFAEHARGLGWREHLLGGDDDMHGCDMLFSSPAPQTDDDDPSFIRRAAAQRWPQDDDPGEP
jgi:hypothetical protein